MEGVAHFPGDSDVTGPSRHWMSNMAYTSKKVAPAGDGSDVSEGDCWLFGDSVGALAGFVLRGLDLLPSLAAEDADETAHCVRLSVCRGHDLGQRCASRPLH